MSTKNKREPLHIEKADDLDPEAFADKITDKIVDQCIIDINRQLKAAGKPPLKK